MFARFLRRLVSELSEHAPPAPWYFWALAVPTAAALLVLGGLTLQGIRPASTPNGDVSLEVRLPDGSVQRSTMRSSAAMSLEAADGDRTLWRTVDPADLAVLDLLRR